VIALLFLLPFLAYKQYEWLGKVSASEREQMLENMRARGSRFRDDFDREITRVYSSFQYTLPRDGSIEVSALRSDYAALYSNWMRTAPYASLVEDIFLIDQLTERPSHVERFNTSTLEFDKVDWPASLLPLRTPSPTTMNFVFKGGSQLQKGVERIFRITGPVNAEIPAVIISLMQSPRLSPGVNLIDLPRSVAQIVVKLNLDYIQKEFIPALARLHLYGDDGLLDYAMSIVNPAGRGRPIFSSGDSEFKGDVTLSILSARPGDYLPVPPIAVGASRDVFEKHVNGRVSVQIMQSGTPLVAAAGFKSNDGFWELALTHRSGSLDAAVAQTRQRNLIISFSILLLLALSVALILISAQRERRLAQQQLEFVSAVSHELRTPLAVICSAGENLADGVVRSEEQTRQYGTLVRNEGRRLAAMVEQVLDFAGIQSGRKTYNLEHTDVPELIDRALETFEMQIRDSGVVLERQLADNLPLVLADRAAFIRALQNLIANALKYGAAGRWLSIRASATSENVSIVVEDRGSGISATDLPHIFEPFYRGRSVVDAQIKGSGLGLALVKQIVESHNARISVESSPERGTAFTVVIPAAGSVPNFVGSHDQAYSPR